MAEVRVRAVGPVLGSIGENNGGSTRIGVTSESEGASTTALALALSPAPPPWPLQHGVCEISPHTLSTREQWEFHV